MSGIEEHMSFLEVLDLLNERLFAEGKEPVAFDSDCREGICGQCGVVINGQAHGPIRSTTCQLHMRHLAEDPSFKDGDTITIEPWRSAGFPILKDLIVDRSALAASSRPGGTSRSTPAPLPRPTRCPCRRRRPTPPSRPRPASAAAHVWRPARTPRPCCSPGRRSRIWGCSRRASPSVSPGWSTCSTRHDAEGFGGLHEHRRVRRGVPQVGAAGGHHAFEPRPGSRPVEGAEGARLSSPGPKPSAASTGSAASGGIGWLSARLHLTSRLQRRG